MEGLGRRIVSLLLVLALSLLAVPDSALATGRRTCGAVPVKSTAISSLALYLCHTILLQTCKTPLRYLRMVIKRQQLHFFGCSYLMHITCPKVGDFN